eukprot:s1039_g1.t1
MQHTKHTAPRKKRILSICLEAGFRDPGAPRCLQAALGSGSVDVCAALLLHGASSADADVTTAAPEVRRLLELFQGRAPEAGELPQVVNSVDPLLRPQVTQMLMDLLSRASAPPLVRAPVPPVPAPPPVPKRVPAMVQPHPSQAKKTSVPSPKVAVPTKPSAVKPPESKPVSRVEVPKSMPKSMNGSKVNPMKPAETNSHAAKTREVPGPLAQVAPAGPKSPLLEAVEAGDLGCVTQLLNGRAEPNEYDRQGETPLFTAASHGSPDVVATLLLCNAEPLTRSIHGRTPWDVASSEPIRSLLNFFAGQELDPQSSDQLLLRLSNATVDAMRLEISERAANRRGLRPIDDGADDGDGASARRRPLPPLPPEVKAARDALAAKDLNQDPLACAARNGDVDEVLRLLESGYNPNVGDELGETPLFEAASAGSVNVVAALLVHRADPDQKSLSGGIAADLATESVTKSLLATYAGIKVSDDEKAACCRAITDDVLREAVANKFRAEMFRGSVLPKYMQKLRA